MKAFKRNYAQILIILSASLLSACGQNFDLAEGMKLSNENASLGGGEVSPPIDNSGPQLSEIDMKAYVSGGQHDGKQVIELDKVKGEILFLLPLLPGEFIELAPVAVRELPGVTVETVVRSNMTYLALRLPIKYITRKVNFLNPGKLPNGNPLPGVPDGELPRLSIALKSDVKLQLYLGVNVFGLFLETDFDPFLGLTLPLKNQAGTKTVGYFATIPARGGFQGGFYLMTSLPPEISRVLDRHFGGL